MMTSFDSTAVEEAPCQTSHPMNFLKDILDGDLANGPWVFMQCLDIYSLVAIGATSKRLQQLSRGSLEGNATSYYERLYRKLFYFEQHFPLYWAPRGYADWVVRLKARYATCTWVSHEDRVHGHAGPTVGGVAVPAALSPQSPSSLIMQRSLDLRLEAVLTGRFFFYPDMDRLDADIDGPDDVNLMCASMHPKFTAFAQAYRSRWGEMHLYETLRELEEGQDDPSDPQIWFDVDASLQPRFVKQVLRWRPFGYGDRVNQVCYWDASGAHIYHDYGFKTVSVAECMDMQHCPNQLAFGAIDGSSCHNRQMHINEREVWTTMLFVGYLGTIGCNVWDAELAAMRGRVGARGSLWSCDVCGVREGSAAIFRCSRCKQARYCSAQCQKKAWGVHKAVCQAST